MKTIDRKITGFIILIFLAGTSRGQDYFQHASSSLFHDHYSSVVKFGDYAYCGGENGLQVIDVSDSTAPVFVNCIRGNYFGDLAISLGDNGLRLCFIRGKSLRVTDISDPINPIPLGEYQTPMWQIQCFDVDGDYAYLATDSSWASYHSYIEVVDISDPESPTMVSRTSAYSFVSSLDAVDGYVYTTYDVDLNPSGFQIFDVTDPNHIQYAGSVEYEYFTVWTVAAYEDYAYVGSDGGILIFDIYDRSYPYVVDTLYNIWSFDLKVFDHYLFAVQENSIYALDIADPVNPVLLSEYDTNIYQPGLFWDDYILYCTSRLPNYASTLDVIGYSDAENPVLTGRYVVPGEVMDVRLFENYAYIANNYSGLQPIDISDPYNPVIIKLLSLIFPILRNLHISEPTTNC